MPVRDQTLAVGQTHLTKLRTRLTDHPTQTERHEMTLIPNSSTCNTSVGAPDQSLDMRQEGGLSQVLISFSPQERSHGVEVVWGEGGGLSVVHLKKQSDRNPPPT